MEKSIPIIEHFTALLTFKKMPDFWMLEKGAELFCRNLKLNIVNKLSHSFKPNGDTLIFILSQSHLAIHTWPEYNLAHLDLVSCVKLEEEQFKGAIKNSFHDITLIEIKP
jgi:S-adenosylmethionine/arginine decarboxylase-like enzyme